LFTMSGFAHSVCCKDNIIIDIFECLSYKVFAGIQITYK